MSDDNFDMAILWLIALCIAVLVLILVLVRLNYQDCLAHGMQYANGACIR